MLAIDMGMSWGKASQAEDVTWRQRIAALKGTWAIIAMFFRVIVIKFLAIGLITPPVGLNVYMLKGVMTENL